VRADGHGGGGVMAKLTAAGVDAKYVEIDSDFLTILGVRP
jgi:hypothetical protein